MSYTCEDCGYLSLGTDDTHDCITVLKEEVENSKESDEKYVPVLTVEEAHKAKVCRYCGGPDSELPFTYDYGHEYAHSRCAPQARGDKDFEACVHLIRNVMHLWHYHHKRAKAYQALGERDACKKEEDKASEAWKRVRPALRKLLEDKNG